MPTPSNALTFALLIKPPVLRSTTSTSLRTLSTLPTLPTSLPPETPKQWDFAGLRKETERQILRTHKKLSKASSIPPILPTAPHHATHTLPELQERLKILNTLDGLLRTKPSTERNDAAIALALSVDLSDEPPKIQPRGPKKEKATHTPRLPYRTYTSSDDILIFVGKKAEDNDVVSTSPDVRSGRDWWMHAQGCAGSHIIIKHTEDTIPPNTILEAAALAARHSKCAGSNNVKVSLTRCRNVSKPSGVAAGMVQIRGEIKTVRVDLKKMEGVLEKLDSTVVV